MRGDRYAGAAVRSEGRAGVGARQMGGHAGRTERAPEAALRPGVHQPAAEPTAQRPRSAPRRRFRPARLPAPGAPCWGPENPCGGFRARRPLLGRGPLRACSPCSDPRRFDSQTASRRGERDECLRRARQAKWPREGLDGHPRRHPRVHPTRLEAQEKSARARDKRGGFASRAPRGSCVPSARSPQPRREKCSRG